MGKHFENDIEVMAKCHDISMRTYYEVVNEEGKVGLPFSERSCFASARSWIQGHKGTLGYSTFQYVKYYMWSSLGSPGTAVHKTAQEVAARFLQTVMKIPFVQRSVVEFTGINSQPGVKDHYVLVDMSNNPAEAFTTLQLFRLAQEMLGHMYTYARVLEDTDNEWLAFALACQFSNCEGTPRTDGHMPTNCFSLAWWDDFIKDPSMAKSDTQNWISDVICPANRGAWHQFHVAKNALLKGDIPKHLVLVYGTLRQGFGNHRIISEAVKGGMASRKALPRIYNLAARMYDTGCGFPALVPDAKGSNVVVEAYYVNDHTFSRLDQLEGYPNLYDRVQVEFEGEPAWIYIQSDSRGYKPIKSGDWKRHAKNG